MLAGRTETHAQRPLLGLLLAAGRGSRFDATGSNNKLLAQIDGEAIAVRSAQKLRQVVDNLVIVVRPGSERLIEALRVVDAVISVCDDAALGMGHSLAHGVALAQRQSQPRALLVALADMPFIAQSTLQQLAQAADAGQPSIIAAPRFAGHRGHPVLFGRDNFLALQASKGDTGASELLRSAPITWIDVDDSGVLRDVDRPEDLSSSASPSPQGN